MRVYLICLAAAGVVCAADNVLSPQEKAAGWKLLFDGRSLKGWVDLSAKNVPGDAWSVENGTVKANSKTAIREDLISRGNYSDFEMVFDWKVTPGGNTGVKYRIQSTLFVDSAKNNKGRWEEIVARELTGHPSDRRKFVATGGAQGQEYVVGFEMQLIDDERHPDARRDKRHVTGALYSMIPPQAAAAHPAGEWNTGRVAVRGQHFEHWINGKKVLEGSLNAPEVHAGVARRWEPAPAFREMLTHPKPSGPVSLQHHGDEVWFKNVKLRPIH
jgi:hypothetical protein